MRHVALALVAFTIACGGDLGFAPGGGGGDGGGGDGGGGAACASGGDPIRLATATHPIAIALDATNVYWVDDTLGTVNEVPVCGGSAKTLVDTTTLGSKTLAPAGIAVAGGEVYFTTTDRWDPDPNGTVWRIPATGGTPTMLSSHMNYPGPIVVTGDSMVWIDEWNTPSDDGRILEAALDGSGMKVLASAQNGPLALALGGDQAVWTLSGSLDSEGGSIVETPMGGGAMVDGIVVGQNTPVGVAVEGADIYWVDSGDPNVEDDGRVMKRPLDPNLGGNPTTLASGGVPQGLAVDAANVYWTDSASQSVQKIPLGGGTPTTVATKQVGLLAIAVDAASVYWLRIAEGTGEGAIMKTSK